MLGGGEGNGWKELKSPKLGCYKSLKTIQATGWDMWRARVSLRPVHYHPRTHPPKVIQAAPQEPLQVQAACFLNISSINNCIPEAFLARMKLLHEKKKKRQAGEQIMLKLGKTFTWGTDCCPSQLSPKCPKPRRPTTVNLDTLTSLTSI